ncbi:MAG: phospho-N-acetylmuramoyl-pentapeptide-transferase [Candidatus Yanofskybacteria bacterium RIFCSPLOWO2_12_FULL_43_11b]|uniref:Phospho-N-acetylmuramoyl-pentapeptide-transferase n=1 Tax=Candidatus Yanofskybacteria bacterium RIFCSPLOWO2_12_FULL_43_11b TaxID=1802710 RepID=A0A1F8H9A7_9BACT|nr:MAG: phospho-N-acetylmuramoyl-pentapeptide-transferase [Candidatus Yanofskybacteria bacterium RIFCSPHIGHO2_01_FULL_43_32]OGN11259.1 MAG: phospho-N-acetylmuramoyl-pentapeptide-transferase [Candidatus Yanofskybacteria bacterium RIFCSPHIGHO2_02_FULL_43_12]OGN17625.1 MAG: phospho-N-acetylmuramoyl-pentapeptide-transferase [Candidatus Yanofskybacteria bacterium RIFCSPHIGHO2_12_FULL_43_11]OGN24180.1 MAG: phospho-N-acetylmuramoyl-pentapeptide-transferase [Candidatus Yanofskybacteria bacterium RIFCSPL
MGLNSEIFSVLNVVRIFVATALAFFVALLITPVWTKILHKYKLGKQIRTDTAFKSLHTEGGPIAAKLHQAKEGTPTMGGVVMWTTVAILTIGFWLPALYFDGFWTRMNFFSRSQTWLPLGVMIFGALLGALDDYMGILRVGPKGGGLRMSYRILLYILAGAVGAWWFYFKLGFNSVNFPFLGDFLIGWWYIPFFVFTIVATAFSANETDGLDGLAGGIFLTMFGAYAVIAFDQGRMDLVVFLSAIMGSLVAFLWFNIYPARFFMGDTGSMSLGVTLGVVAMLTNTPFLLIPIGIIFFIESGSVIIQLTSKKLRGKKIFLSTPIHHHFEALGWHETQVTMRFWMISAVGAIIGLIIFLVDSKIPPLFR